MSGVHHPTARGHRGRKRTRLTAGDRPEVASIRQTRLMDDTPVPDGYEKCEACGRVIPLRRDGTLRGHRSSSTIPCIGATPR